ncbi:WAT1-related protein [Hibiscus syriacus]|uniref:WAT1-related protein n=1 Tax=Hibiscus syriacus TaxID=106335 RepID=A0A6A2YCL7_HIBSY|nr:WAT1-related protein [Hibiscus syriacus]
MEATIRVGRHELKRVTGIALVDKVTDVNPEEKILFDDHKEIESKRSLRLLLPPILDQGFFYLGMKYTSASFTSAIMNAVPSVTFVIALIFRFQPLKFVHILSDQIGACEDEVRSIAKVIGTLVTLSGALLMTLYKGRVIELIWSRNTSHHGSRRTGDSSDKHWISGTLLILVGCVAWSCFYVLQSITKKKYRAELSLSSLICLAGTIQSLTIALAVEHHPSGWAMGLNSRLFAPLYSGIFSSGITYYVQGLVMKTRGPVFVTAFNPLCMIIVAALGSALLGEQIHLGRLGFPTSLLSDREQGGLSRAVSAAVRLVSGRGRGRGRGRGWFLANGVQQRVSCPSTSEQNGKAERKHIHVVEMGLALLAEAALPLKFWSHAFLSAVHLINRLPTEVLNGKSPFEVLYQQTPDYSMLKVFGCACFPLLRPFNQHKLDFRSKQCVFLGYSPSYKGYKCLDENGRIFISRHVVFDEEVFPYSEGKAANPSRGSSDSILPIIQSTRWSNQVAGEAPNSTCAYTQDPGTLVADAPHVVGAIEDSTCAGSDSITPADEADPGSSASTNLNGNEFELCEESQPTTTQCDEDQCNVHPMVTEASGIYKPKVFQVACSDKEPHTIREAMKSSEWKAAAQAEYDALMKTTRGRLFHCRVVGNQFLQQPGIDYHEVFSPVVKPATAMSRVMVTWSVNSTSHYGLKQAPQAWFEKLKEYLENQRFVLSRSDASLFVKETAGTIVYLLVYVDDIIVRCLAVVKETAGTIVGLEDAKGLPTMATSCKLTVDNGTPVKTLLTIALQYVVITRPDIAFAVNRVCQFMQSPCDIHLQAVKRILRYLQATVDFGLRFLASSRLSLTGFADANWGSDADDRRSTSGYCIYFAGNLVSWGSRKQQVVARSTAEAEYRSVACAAAEMAWLESLLRELRVTVHGKFVLWCDNSSAVAVCANPILHSKFKHVELDLFFVREMVAAGKLFVQEIPAFEQVADVLTKPLSAPMFLKHRQWLLVSQIPDKFVHSQVEE